MVINMSLPLILLLFLCVSCGGGHSKKIHYGQTTEASLLEMEGPPASTTELKYAEGKMLIYDEEKKFQIQSGIVVSSFQDPKGDEKNLIYWKHKFKDCLTSDLRATGAEERKERILSCEAQGVSVIYSEGTGSVLRVVEHEKK